MVLGNMEKDERKTDRSAAGGGSLIRAVREDLMEKVTFERSSEWVERKPRPALGMNRQSNQGGSLRQACARQGAVGVGVGVGGGGWGRGNGGGPAKVTVWCHCDGFSSECKGGHSTEMWTASFWLLCGERSKQREGEQKGEGINCYHPNKKVMGA